MAIAPQPHRRRIPCERCPLRQNPILREFTPDELLFVSRFKTGEIDVSPGANIFIEGSKSEYLYTVLSGWAFRYKTLPDGRRQILNYALPGDFLGLQGAIAAEMQHSVEALTEMTLCVFPRAKLWDLYNNHPTLAFDVTWLGARSELLLDEGLLNVGRRNALERAAYLLLHLFTRAEELGMTKGRMMRLPVTQTHVADTLGMSLVHTNKTLRRLAATRTMRWKDRSFEILDRNALMALASFEGAGGFKRPFI
jgi:CRP-like cAMP-binding protein